MENSLYLNSTDISIKRVNDNSCVNAKIELNFQSTWNWEGISDEQIEVSIKKAIREITTGDIVDGGIKQTIIDSWINV